MENPFKKKTVVELVRGVEVASGIHLSTATYGINLVGEDDHYLGFTTEEIRTLHEVLGHYLATVDGVEEPQPDRPFQVGDRVVLVERQPEDPPVGTVGTVVLSTAYSFVAVWDDWDRGWVWGDRGGKKNCWAVERSAVRHYS